MKTFDELLFDINDFGRYQKTKYFLICLAGLLPPIATYIHIFLAASPDIRCEIDSKHYLNLNKSMSDNCNYYSNNTQYKCTSWEYSKMYYESTLTEEWNMVCDRSFWRLNVQSIYFVGYLVGSLVLGYLSDKFGRRPIMVASFLLILMGAIGSALGPQKSFGVLASYIIYSISRFLMACGTRGINETGYVLALELVSQRRRVLAAIGFEHFFSLGQLILVFTAFFIRDWRTLALVFIIPVVPFLSYYFLLAESPRWLIQQNRQEEAILILQDVAKTNKTNFDKKSWEIYINKLNNNKEEKKETFFTLIKSLIVYPKQSILILTMLFNWIVNNLVFYGVGLKSNDLGINPYVSFAISATVEMMSFSIVLFLIDKFGRKKIYFLFLFSAGTFCISIMFISNLYVGFIFAMIGKFAISGSYAILRLYSNEVFPTSIRNSCMGACSTFSRFGVIVAPLINSLGDTYKSLPFLIFGIFGILASFSTFLLPETLNRQLPENIADAHRLNSIGNNHKKVQESVDLDLKESFLELKA